MMVNDQQETTAPLIHFGEHSDWYIGTRVEMRPTPKPVKKRPAMKVGRVKAPVWRATPRQKTTHEINIPVRRPQMSAIGAPPRAPVGDAFSPMTKSGDNTSN